MSSSTAQRELSGRGNIWQLLADSVKLTFSQLGVKAPRTKKEEHFDRGTEIIPSRTPARLLYCSDLLQEARCVSAARLCLSVRGSRSARLLISSHNERF